MQRTIFAFILILAFGSCSRPSSADYYRQRAWMANDDVAHESTRMEKKELKVARYRTQHVAQEEVSISVSDSYSAQKALEEGNKRYTGEVSAHPHLSKATRKENSLAQHPHTAVLSCSDSRVPPELVFDQGIGDLFVVRTAGEVADPASVASLEYAVEHLGVKMLLVMGHSSCGAVKATLSTSKDQSAGSKYLDNLLASIRPNVKNYTTDNSGPGYEHAVRAQVNGVAEGLPKRSKIIHEAMEKHGLRVVRGMYHLDSGVVDFW